MQSRSEQADAPLDSQLERGNKKKRSHKQHDRDALQRVQDKRGTTMLHLRGRGGANQLVLCCESTFGLEGVKNQEETRGGRLRPEVPSGSGGPYRRRFFPVKKPAVLDTQPHPLPKRTQHPKGVSKRASEQASKQARRK